jgi:hypothetical protein
MYRGWELIAYGCPLDRIDLTGQQCHVVGMYVLVQALLEHERREQASEDMRTEGL